MVKEKRCGALVLSSRRAVKLSRYRASREQVEAV